MPYPYTFEDFMNDWDKPWSEKKDPIAFLKWMRGEEDLEAVEPVVSHEDIEQYERDRWLSGEWSSIDWTEEDRIRWDEYLKKHGIKE